MSHLHPATSPSLSPESSAVYSDEAVQEILSTALTLQAKQPFSTQQLQEMAAELDISPDLLDAAIAQWQSPSPKAAHAVHPQPPRLHRQHWQKYVLTSALMIGIDIATAGRLTWSIFPVLGWGLGLALGRCDRPQYGSKRRNRNCQM